MKSELSDLEIAFRQEVRDFLQDSLPGSISDKVKLGKGISKDELIDWTRILHKKGWAAPNWPKEDGGTGWTMVQRLLFDVECRLSHAPPLSGFGFNMVGPAIIRYGSAEQKQHYLPKIISGQEWWCQGYSEPQAGSDLASVKTRAVSDGDDYVVNGSKIWTSAAESADQIFCLVRTDPDVKPQRGISFLLIDMKSPGITVQPLIALNGKRLWNQVFFDDVRVPKANRLGKENEGWSVAKNLLGNERLLVSRVAENRRLLTRVIEIINSEQESGIRFELELQHKLSELDIRLRALDASAFRLLIDADRGGVIGAEPSMLKLLGSQLVQDMDILALEAIGYYAMPIDSTMRGEDAVPIGPDYCDMVASGLFHHRGFTIAGGSSEVQHNIIAKNVLGLA